MTVNRIFIPPGYLKTLHLFTRGFAQENKHWNLILTFFFLSNFSLPEMALVFTKQVQGQLCDRKYQEKTNKDKDLTKIEDRMDWLKIRNRVTENIRQWEKLLRRLISAKWH